MKQVRSHLSFTVLLVYGFCFTKIVMEFDLLVMATWVILRV